MLTIIASSAFVIGVMVGLMFVPRNTIDLTTNNGPIVVRRKTIIFIRPYSTGCRVFFVDGSEQVVHECYLTVRNKL